MPLDVLIIIPYSMSKGSLYYISAWGFQRCSVLGGQGNAKTFTSWNRAQDWLHVFVCMLY